MGSKSGGYLAEWTRLQCCEPVKAASLRAAISHCIAPHEITPLALARGGSGLAHIAARLLRILECLSSFLSRRVLYVEASPGGSFTYSTSTAAAVSAGVMERGVIRA